MNTWFKKAHDYKEGSTLDCKHRLWDELHWTDTVGLGLRHIRVKHFPMLISVLIMNFTKMFHLIVPQHEKHVSV